MRRPSVDVLLVSVSRSFGTLSVEENSKYHDGLFARGARGLHLRSVELESSPSTRLKHVNRRNLSLSDYFESITAAIQAITPEFAQGITIEINK